MKVLRGDASLFGRLLQALEQSSQYLNYLKTGRDAPLFLLSWHHYLQAKVALSIVPAAHSSAIAKPTDPTLCPDTLLELVGSLSVVAISSTLKNIPNQHNFAALDKSSHSIYVKKGYNQSDDKLQQLP